MEILFINLLNHLPFLHNYLTKTIKKLLMHFNSDTFPVILKVDFKKADLINRIIDADERSIVARVGLLTFKHAINLR